MTKTTTEPIGTAEVAKMLHLSVRTVNRKAKAGTLPAVKIGENTSSYVFDRAEIERLAALPTTPVSATSPQKADTGVSSSANPMAAPSASVEKSADQKPKGARAA